MRRMAASSGGVSWSKPRRCRAPWDGEQAELVGEWDGAGASAARGDRHGDDQRAELGDAVGVAQAGDVGVEGEHVGGLVEAEVAGVETSHGAGVGQAQGDGARGPEAPGVEGVSDGVGEEGGVGAVAEWGVDVDVDAVGGGHGGRGAPLGPLTTVFGRKNDPGRLGPWSVPLPDIARRNRLELDQELECDDLLGERRGCGFLRTEPGERTSQVRPGRKELSRALFIDLVHHNGYLVS